VGKFDTLEALLARIKFSLSRKMPVWLGKTPTGPKAKHTYKKRTGVIEEGFYNKSLFRIFARKITPTPARPHTGLFKSADGRATYQGYSDGSRHRIVSYKKSAGIKNNA
jgi:hypothetical protein